ncbi:hypothetical protein M9H77_35529 [Catharanthus roseus]|uniref:Uncharacterized protein n=1 Tax=Catharanthus roseus TaxID=4058 RepID=A0ACB9ZQ65_CATRO|nr:hypothetical protein M9H77_35529 [Catharanthus roseus]
MDSVKEFLQENVGCEVRKSIEFFFSVSGSLSPNGRNNRGDEDPNTFEEFLELEKYIDLGHLFTTDRIFNSKDELPIVNDEEEEITIKRRTPYGTAKCGCPFKLKGEQMTTSENWQLFVHNGRYNHKIAVYNHGHAQAARLTEE